MWTNPNLNKCIYKTKSQIQSFFFSSSSLVKVNVLELPVGFPNYLTSLIFLKPKFSKNHSPDSLIILTSKVVFRGWLHKVVVTMSALCSRIPGFTPSRATDYIGGTPDPRSTSGACGSGHPALRDSVLKGKRQEPQVRDGSWGGMAGIEEGKK